MLYAGFGMVQLFLPFSFKFCCCIWGLKGKNRTTEIIYICLSLVAKFLLGSILFAQVLFA